MVIWNRCFRPLHSASAPPSHHHRLLRPWNSLMYFTCALIGTMARTHFSAIQNMLWAIWMNSWRVLQLRAMHKGSHIDAVRLRELKRADVVLAHTGRKTPGFEMHARVERRLARLELEYVQSMIAIFTHSQRWKWHTASDLQKGEHVEYPCWRPRYFKE